MAWSNRALLNVNGALVRFDAKLVGRIVSGLGCVLSFKSFGATGTMRPVLFSPVPEGITNMLVNKETGKPVAAGQPGFLESFVAGFDPNSDTSSVFDQSAQGGTTKPSSLDDADYWQNQ